MAGSGEWSDQGDGGDSVKSKIMSKKVLSFGELLLRICPDGDSLWLKGNTLPCYVGGAEANVATALALWGVPSAYFTVLPENMMGRQLTGYLEERGIDTSRVIYQGARLGLYFLPKGKDLKNAGVIYDRDYSSFSNIQPGSIDWDEILQDTAWLHFSAISPALNSRLALVCEEAVRAASVKNITVSVDLNYRAKLWQYGCAPSEVMPGLVEYCDLVMGNLWAAEKMLGIPVSQSITEKSGKEEYLAHAVKTSEAIMRRWPKAKMVANTFRFDSPGADLSSVPGGDGAGIRYYTTLYAGGELYSSKEYLADSIVDKVGSGDCYMGGLIYGQYSGKGYQETLDFATAAAFQKLFISNDATNQRVEEIQKFIQSYE
jgi:2-dehydro-3-deoxygluconokinase